MITLLSSRLLGPVRAALRVVATVAVLALLAQGASAQDNDDDVVVPFTGAESSDDQGATNGNAAGGSGSSEKATLDAVLVAGELDDGIDTAEATLEFETGTGSTEVVTEAPVEQATFVAHPPGISAGDNGVGPTLQGAGQLHLREGLGVRFVAAQSAAKRAAVLVIAKDGPSLEAELAGKTHPELVLPLGDLASIDVVKLAALSEKFAESLPGYHATLVLVSVEVGVGLHTSAVRTHTSGGPVDVLVR